MFTTAAGIRRRGNDLHRGLCSRIPFPVMCPADDVGRAVCPSRMGGTVHVAAATVGDPIGVVVAGVFVSDL